MTPPACFIETNWRSLHQLHVKQFLEVEAKEEEKKQQHMIKTWEKVGGVSASIYSINTGKIIELEEMPFAAGTGGAVKAVLMGYYTAWLSEAKWETVTCLENKIPL